MFIRAEKKVILEAITPALCAVSTRATAVAYECLCFMADEKKGVVTVTSFDNNKGVKTSFAATVLEGGGLLLNGHTFSSFVRTLPEGEVSISNDERFVTTISCQKSKFEIAGMSETNFPALPEISGEKKFSFTQGTLKKMLNGVIFSFLQEDTKPALTGVLFDLSGEQITLCSCDGYRISLTREALKTETQESFIVPGKTLTELIRLLQDSEEEPIEIALARKHVIFSFDNLVLFSRLVDGEFIDYKNTLPAAFSCTARFSATAALQSVERASLVIDERTDSPVVMTLESGTVYMKSQTVNGKVEEEFAADIQGEGLTIGFRARFLASALRAAGLFGEEEVFMEFVSPLKGAVLHPLEGEAFYYLILPVKL